MEPLSPHANIYIFDKKKKHVIFQNNVLLRARIIVVLRFAFALAKASDLVIPGSVISYRQLTS